MLKKININSTVKVKLNEYGIQKLKKEYAYKTIDDGVVKLQMWELFYIFGSDYTIGNTKLPFGTTMYIYEEDVKPLDKDDRQIKLTELDGEE